MTELYAALQPVLDEHESFHKHQAEEEKEGKERAVQLAVMGLPNVVSTTSHLSALFTDGTLFTDLTM